MVLFASFLLCSLAYAAEFEPQTSELHGGRWIDVANPSSRPAVDPGLVGIEKLVLRHSNRAAIHASIDWLKANKDSPVRDKGLYLMAQALYQYGNRVKSFFYLDELLDEYPESPLFYQALEKQYQIADEYLNGYRIRFLGIPMFHAQEEAIEMMFRIQQRSPGSPLAERALLRTADHYYASGDYDLAEDAYGAYAKAYPRSDELPRVKLMQAYSNLAQFRGLRFDATPVIDAKAQLEDIIAAYPDLAAKENLASIVDRIDTTFARKLEVTADFYRRTHEPRASAYTYNYLIQTYPGSVEAQHAERVLGRSQPTTRP